VDAAGGGDAGAPASEDGTACPGAVVRAGEVGEPAVEARTAGTTAAIKNGGGGTATADNAASAAVAAAAAVVTAAAAAASAGAACIVGAAPGAGALT